jgi:hypothetical protein
MFWNTLFIKNNFVKTLGKKWGLNVQEYLCTKLISGARNVLVRQDEKVSNVGREQKKAKLEIKIKIYQLFQLRVSSG